MKASVLKAVLEELGEKNTLTVLDELRKQKTEKSRRQAALGQFLESSRLRYRELCDEIEENERHKSKKKDELDSLQKAENEAHSLLQRIELDSMDRDKEHELLEQRRNELYNQKNTKTSLKRLEKELQKSVRLKYLSESEAELNLYARSVRAVINEYARDRKEQGIFGPWPVC